MITAGDRTCAPGGAFMTLTRLHWVEDPDFAGVKTEELETIRL
jgi:hypothetical protein